MAVTATPLAGLPEVRPGDDLGGLLARAATAELALRDGDVLAVAHKVVSKAEGRVRALAEVEADSQARELAAAHDKDPRAVQVVLDETAELLRAERGVLICRTRHGFVCANAGVDASNAPASDTLVLLPRDPDASARHHFRDLTSTPGGWETRLCRVEQRGPGGTQRRQSASRRAKGARAAGRSPHYKAPYNASGCCSVASGGTSSFTRGASIQRLSRS